MKLKLKKYIYFVNDVTNMLLKKEEIHQAENAQKFRIALISVIILLIISIGLNIFLLLK